MIESGAVYMTEAQIDDYYDTRQEIYLKRYYHIQAKRQMREHRDGLIRLAFVSVLVLLVCTIFLQLSFQVQQRTYRVSVLEKELNAIRLENEDASRRLEHAVDLAQLCEEARELGMVYPQAKHVVYYQVADSDYMLQTQDIPK